MPRLWLWENGDTAVLDMPPLGKGQWIKNCKFCGMVPEVIWDEKERGISLFCINTDCLNNRRYTFEEWNKDDFENHSISLEERVKRLEKRLDRFEERMEEKLWI